MNSENAVSEQKYDDLQVAYHGLETDYWHLRALNAELLAALELMLNTYNWTGITSEAQRAARAALAEAKEGK